MIAGGYPIGSVPLGHAGATPGPDPETVAARVALRATYALTLEQPNTAAGALALPLASFQSTLRADPQSSYLECVVPGVAAYAADITAADTGAAQLVIRRTAVYSDGTTDTAEVARVDFEGFRYDRGARANSGTLSGTAAMVNATAKTVELQDASYYSSDDGARRVRCGLSATIRPGDTASVLGETFAVNRITLYVSPGAEQMEVSEETLV